MGQEKENVDESAAIAAYLISMDKLMKGTLTIPRREDYRWGFYDGTQWKKERMYSADDMEKAWEAALTYVQVPNSPDITEWLTDYKQTKNQQQ